MKTVKERRIFAVMLPLLLVLFAADIGSGAVSIPACDIIRALSGTSTDIAVTKIVTEIRLVKAIAAVLSGMALSVSGLQMQTLFRNPLAGPYVLGISSGASLGVALFILGAPFLGLTVNAVLSDMGTAGAAWAGSALILIIIAAAGRRIKDIMVILILGMMLSSAIGAVVQILQYASHQDALKSYIIWTMGSLGDVTLPQLMILVPSVLLGLLLSVISIKPLNMLHLGENYALTMGLDMKRSRTTIFTSTTLLAGSVTAFCGPIGFIGLAVPHITRRIFSNADHRILVPGSAITGAIAMLVCDILSKSLALPVNTVTSLLGIPVVIWVVMKNRNI